jgi:hypothetical protein
VLPEVDQKSESLQKAADFGKAVALWQETGVVLDMLGSERQRERFRGLDRARYWPSAAGHHEMVLWYDPRTGDAGAQPVGKGRDRFKGIPWSAALMIADFVVLTGDPWLDDTKTGWQPALPEHHKQLWVGALVVWKLTGRSPRMTITALPRYPLDGKPERSRAYVPTVDELAAFEWLLLDAYASHELEAITYAAGVEPTTMVGEHCKWCKSKGVCPPQLALAAEQAATQEDTNGET